MTMSRNFTAKSRSENRSGKGDSPILLGGTRKIGTVPNGFRIGSKPQAKVSRRACGLARNLAAADVDRAGPLFRFRVVVLE